MGILFNRYKKNHSDLSDPDVRASYGVLSGMVGLISNLLLAMAKLVIGYLSSSVSIMADAVNNLMDMISSSITLVGFNMAKKPADRSHPFGHMRIENLIGVIISILIVMLGISFLRDSVETILTGSSADFSIPSIVVLVASIVIKIWQSLFYRKVGKLINSNALITTSIDSRNDVVMTSVVTIGALFERLTGFHVDGWIGIVVSGFVVASGVQMVLENANPLLGMPPEKKLIKDVIRTVLSFEGVMEVHDLIIHNYGSGVYFATLHVEVDEHMDIVKAHALTDKIEKAVKDNTNVNLVIHVEPFFSADPAMSAMRNGVADILSQIDPALTFHDFHMEEENGKKTLIFDLLYPEEINLTKQELHERITEELKKHYPDIETRINVEPDISDFLSFV